MSDHDDLETTTDLSFPPLDLPAGDVNGLFAAERPALVRFVSRRLSRQLRTRLDASDVVQEIFREAYRRFEDYQSTQPMPFRLWLRKLAFDRVAMEYRRHVGAAQRSVGREAMVCDDSSAACAERFVADESTPSGKLHRQERIAAVRRALENLEPTDREILCLRMVDELPYSEIAALLEMQAATARQRYGRALAKLGIALGVPGELS